MLRLLQSIVFFLPFLVAPLATASDHIDGQVTRDHAVADLADLYAFLSPEHPDRLSLVLNVYPMVGKSGHFSDKVDYQFILREVEPVGAGELRTSNERVITCSLAEQREHSEHTVTCGIDGTDLFAQARWAQQKSFDGFRVYAGKHSDPFFFNAKWVKALVTKGELVESDGSNIMDQLNVLSIVVEIELSRLFTNQPGWVGVTARSVTNKNADNPNEQLDWVGRPEITNFSIWADADDDFRDEYNSLRPFQRQPKIKDRARKLIADHIVNHYDGADKKEHWKIQDAEDFADLLVEDFLLLSTSPKCTKPSFLDIELSFMRSGRLNGCGGRGLEDDIVDRLLSVYVTGEFNGVSDRVSRPYRSVAKRFPYLAQPDLSWSARMKAWFARNVF